MCERTVSLESTSTLAIWSFVRPSATRSMTSHSRAVSGDLTGRSPVAPSGDRRSCSISFMLIRRLIAASPLRTPRSACGSTSMSTSLARKPAAPGAQPEHADLVLVGRREDDHELARVVLDDPARRGDPVELGHDDVHQDDVRLVVAREIDGLAAVVCLGDHDHPGALQRLLDHLAGERIVVGDDRPDRIRAQAAL